MSGIAVFVISAAALAIERVSYVWIWRNPDDFESLCRRFHHGMAPVDAVVNLFHAFKVIQIGVFVGWCLWWGNGVLGANHRELPVLVSAGALFFVGQGLNLAVFHNLGRAGVFYGVRFGHAVPWCNAFPFNLLRHPQYVGAAMSVWAFFLLFRYPDPDWVVLPTLETAYYLIGARYESGDYPSEDDQSLKTTLER